MERTPRTTEHYDEHLIDMDEQICNLLKQRKVLSNNPGMPPDDLISQWAAKYGLDEIFLNQIFGTIRYEHLFKTKIEPIGFRKQLPILKAIEVGERIYSVTVIKQYENASVIQLHVDCDKLDDSPIDLTRRRDSSTFELFVDEKYDCRKDRAGGANGYISYSFIVTPALPDDVSGIDPTIWIYLFKKIYEIIINNKPTIISVEHDQAIILNVATKRIELTPIDRK